MKPFYFTVFVVIFLLGIAGQSAAEINSLRTEALTSTAEAPKLMRFIKDKENVERTFKEQPPVVPHETEKYAVNLKENKCLDCHVTQPGKKEPKSVEIGESHYIDRNGKKHDMLVGGRYFCSQCHVPQVNAPPLVESNFQAAK